ncbi:uncharacterized protein LOC134716217 [Mytilus trossulus]|uniref:uncharacterized protein LOC134716217 n=1 Tax=Mytilus trossulus TaxID=6551 RepID=UPI003005990A
MQVVHGTAGLIQEECKIICKRGTQTLFQKKGYDDFFKFNWDHMYNELKMMCPSMLAIISSIVSDIPPSVNTKPFMHLMVTAAIGLHGRSQEMSAIQYMVGFLLTHGGCTQRDIERLAKIGVCVHPQTIHNKLASWQDKLDLEILSIRDSWANGGTTKYQLIGDNWDKNILPSYRTSDQKTLSLHLFNMYAIVDRVPAENNTSESFLDVSDLDLLTFIPSLTEQKQLMQELTFIFATSVIQNVPQIGRLFKKIYPEHLNHTYSDYAGLKTAQYPLGIYDCNENKTQEVIQLLKELSDKYVPLKDGKIVEPVFFGGDRLTDERIQGAQSAMGNADTAKEKLEGFISKTEDFHRLMNFLEAIHKLTYNSGSGNDPCTAYYYRNLLNMRNVKGKVKNSYRPYKLLYYTILDAVLLLMFFTYFNLADLDSDIPIPENFEDMDKIKQIDWLDTICRNILQQFFFENNEDICHAVREVLSDPEHEVNYWTANLEDGHVKCHFCARTYTYVGSLKSHEMKVHGVQIKKEKKKATVKDQDQLQDYILMLFKLTLLHKNLDTAVDMGDGERCVRSTKYELPIYNKTNKVKYVIASVHLTSLISGVLPGDQSQSLISNRFVNVQGGKNNNIALDEHLEMLNRDSKITCTGHQTKESIIKHSKEYAHLINYIKYFELISGTRKRKGFHHLPSYCKDVRKVAKDLLEHSALKHTINRKLKCKDLKIDRNPFENCVSGLSSMIHRHKPPTPFRRLRDKHI